MRTILIAAFALPILFVLDLLWIGLLASDFYHTQLGALLAPDVVWAPALVFYVLYAIALSFFAITPAVNEQSLKKATLLGAFLGLTAYIGYDLTNWATLIGWPPLVSIVDLAWGIVVSTIASVGAYLIATKIAHL
ncbi:MAG: DUF2177 family protein [Patescibacteria group bacterium]